LHEHENEEPEKPTTQHSAEYKQESLKLAHQNQIGVTKAAKQFG
jgi:transposase-like protein